MFIDTHCHIHELDYQGEEDALKRAIDAGVTSIICVGTSKESSVEAVRFAGEHKNVYVSVGVHPHDSKDGWGQVAELLKTKDKNIVAVGEIGLDYHYNHSPSQVQIKALESQLQLAVDYDLPVIFHVREAFDEFWPIFDNFKKIKGELHSYTDSIKNLNQGLKRGLYIGVNGISTFTRDDQQKEMFDAIPLESMLLETDAPFLTPSPFRGKINEPAFVREIAQYHADRRGISVEEIARKTTANARKLFSI